MKSTTSLFLLLLICLNLLGKPKADVQSLHTMIDVSLERAHSQYVLLAKELEDKEGRIPRTFEKGKLKTANFKAWISGFFPGVLWYLYENFESEELKTYAELYTSRVEEAKYVTNHHDLGFMLYCSFGNGYRLTKNPAYLEVMKVGANSLSTRYNEKIGAIKSWDSNQKWQYPVIIDNMMNLEFLMFMAHKTGVKRFADISNSHAQITLKNHFRPDYSCYHVVSYDTISGKPHAKNTHQGYADDSDWARGQAWALYGYTMMYRETGKKEYLQQAKNVAQFLTNHPKMPEDKVPYWDFDTPDLSIAPRDASSAAIMSSALLELSQMDKTNKSKIWFNYAVEQLKSLSSPQYLAEAGTNGFFILKHSVGNLNKNLEVDVPLTYADYYFVEALLRLKNILNEK